MARRWGEALERTFGVEATMDAYVITRLEDA